MMGFTESGKMVEASEDELAEGLVKHVETILNHWGDHLPKERFVVDEKGEPFVVVAPHEAIHLVALALRIAPTLIERFYAEKLAAEEGCNHPDVPGHNCGG